MFFLIFLRYAFIHKLYDIKTANLRSGQFTDFRTQRMILVTSSVNITFLRFEKLFIYLKLYNNDLNINQ